MKTSNTNQPSGTAVEDGSAFHNVANWVAAVLFLGALGLFIAYFKPTWNFDFDSPDFNPAIFLPFILGGVGLYNLALAVRGTMRAKSFGSSVFEIQGTKVSMGQPLKGVIRASVELHPKSDYEIHLQCIETFEMRGNSTSSTTRSVDRIRWEETIRVAPASVNSISGIPFGFTLPDSFAKPTDSNEKPPPSKLGPFQFSGVAAINIPGLQTVLARNVAPIATRWVLEIKAPLKGIDYYAIFGIVVENSTHDRGASPSIQLDS